MAPAILSPRRRADVEGRVESLHHEFAVTLPGDLALDAICADQNLFAESRPLCGCDARLVCNARFGLATINADLPFVGQKRFALAHELGHWLMHRALRQEFHDDEATLKDYERSVEEAEANHFACGFLLPRHALAPLQASPTLASVREVSEAWSVGPLATLRRFVIDRPGRAVQMVVSRAGVARYSVVPPESPWPATATDAPLPDLPREAPGVEMSCDSWWPGEAGRMIVESWPIPTTPDTLHFLVGVDQPTSVRESS